MRSHRAFVRVADPWDTLTTDTAPPGCGNARARSGVVPPSQRSGDPRQLHPKAHTLEGERGLVIGIANDRSIAYRCARAFRHLGADDLAVTYLNDRARPYVEPSAEEVGASIFMPLDVSVDGQMQAVLAEIEARWRRLDFALHSIAFPPKEDGTAASSTARARAFGARWAYPSTRSSRWGAWPSR